MMDGCPGDAAVLRKGPIMNRTKRIATMLALLVWSGGTANAEPPRLEVGQPFPDLAFPSMEDGAPMSIADFRGQKVILHVFASW